MLKLEELADKLNEYRSQQIDFDDFEDWFRTNSRGAYSRKGEKISDVVSRVECALSRFRFEGIAQELFLVELANAIHPFAFSKQSVDEATLVKKINPKLAAHATAHEEAQLGSIIKAYLVGSEPGSSSASGQALEVARG
jgi:hypothetical protein